MFTTIIDEKPEVSEEILEYVENALYDIFIKYTD